MSDPLVPERSGSLAELGLSPHPNVPLDEENGVEEEAQAATAEEATLPEYEAEMPQEAAESPEGGDQGVEEPQEPESLLRAIMAQDGSKEEESELTRMRQEVAKLKAVVDAEKEAYKEIIRNAIPAQKPEPEPEDEDLLKSAPVRQVLQSLREEDPSEYEAALVRIAEEQTTRKVSKQINELRSMIEQQKEQEQQEQMATRYQQGINRVLGDIEGEGGLEAELIKQLRETPEQSYLGAKFKENPTRLMSEEGIRGTVVTVAAQLKARLGQQQSRGQVVSPSVEASAGGGSASTRGVSLGEKPKQLSPEDQIIEDMMSAGGRTKSLGFL